MGANHYFFSDWSIIVTMERRGGKRKSGRELSGRTLDTLPINSVKVTKDNRDYTKNLTVNKVQDKWDDANNDIKINIDEIVVKSVNIVNITLKTIGEQRDQVHSQRVPSLWRVCLFVCPKLLFQTIILVTIGEQCDQVHSQRVSPLWREGSNTLGLQLSTIPSQGEDDGHGDDDDEGGFPSHSLYCNYPLHQEKLLKWYRWRYWGTSWKEGWQEK